VKTLTAREIKLTPNPQAQNFMAWYVCHVAHIICSIGFVFLFFLSFPFFLANNIIAIENAIAYYLKSNQYMSMNHKTK
jgi:hypothetical protein